MAGCKVADGEKAQGLNNAIHQLKPDANAKQPTKDPERQAKDDLKGIGSSQHSRNVLLSFKGYSPGLLVHPLQMI
jgi:hypothetical protein